MKLEWEEIHQDSNGQRSVERARIPGGWLVRVADYNDAKAATLSLTFVPVSMVRDCGVSIEMNEQW